MSCLNTPECLRSVYVAQNSDALFFTPIQSINIIYYGRSHACFIVAPSDGPTWDQPARRLWLQSLDWMWPPRSFFLLTGLSIQLHAGGARG